MAIGKNQPEIDFYSSPYLAEHYDLMFGNTIEFFKDVNVFWDALLKGSETSPLEGRQTKAFVVLDVGTGTGRILKGFVECAKQSGTDLSHAEFIGIDISQDMVDRAAETWDAPEVGSVSWVRGSATDLPQLVSKKVDLLIFGDGNIAHLSGPKDGERFLAGVAHLLRPQTGRAWVTVVDFDAAVAQYGGLRNVPNEQISRRFPNHVYRNTLLETKRVGDSVETRYKFEVVERISGTEDKTITSSQTVLTGKIWTEDGLTKLVDASDLCIVHTERTNPFQTYYQLASKWGN
jgi:SAM-dependent methyltransferase